MVMITTSRIRQLVILSFLIIPVAIMVGAILAQRKNRDLQKLRGNQHVSKVVTRGSVQELAEWQGGQFKDIDSVEVSQAVSKAVKDSCSDLTETQRAKLHDLIKRFLQAYSTGRFEDYFAFKTQGFQFHLDFDGLSEKLIKSLTEKNNIQLPDEPKAKRKTLWELVIWTKTNNGTGPRLLGLEMSRIKIQIITNMVATSSLLNYATRVSTMYPGFSPNSLVKYDRAPESEIAEAGRLVSALLVINGRFSSADVASPLFVTFYWSDRTKTWYPWELARYQAARFRTLF
jgi:hypothetical protein